MVLGEKLKRLIKTKHKTIGLFAEKIGMNYSQVSQYLNGRQLSIEFIYKIIEEFPEADLNWLLRDNIDHTNAIVSESHPEYKIVRNPDQIIDTINVLLGELRSQLPQK